MKRNRLRIFAAGLAIGMLIVYFGIYAPNIPNYAKPVWLARDAGDDAAFSAATATNNASPDLTVAPSPAETSDSVPGTAPAPATTPDLVSAEQTTTQAESALAQDVAQTSQGVQTIYQAYVDYASQHGVDSNQSFNQIVTVLGNQTQSSNGFAVKWSASGVYLVLVPLVTSYSSYPVAGSVLISYDAPAKTFTAIPAGPTGIKAASVPSIKGPTYYVKATTSTGKALLGQTAQNNFYGASKTFVGGLASNTLKWSKK